MGNGYCCSKSNYTFGLYFDNSNNSSCSLLPTPYSLLPILLIAICSLLFFSCSRKTDAHVIIAGSTSIQPYVELLAEEYALLYPDKNIDIQGGGSSAGITAAENGVADIGMSSRYLKRTEEDLWSIEIARDGLAMIVHPDNPVSDLTMEQVRDIYTSTINNWSQLGGKHARIHIIAREEGSGTRTAFEDMVMGNEYRITPRAIVQASNGAVRQLVAGDINSIGFISLGLVDHTVKALKLNGIAATRENVIDGSYSLFRPFLFVSRSIPPAGSAMEFIEFISSPEGRAIMINEGLVPR